MLKTIVSMTKRISNLSHEMAKKNHLKKQGLKSGVYIIKAYNSDSNFYVMRSGDGYLII